MKAIADYSSRQRRFGKTSEQVIAEKELVEKNRKNQETN